MVVSADDAWRARPRPATARRLMTREIAHQKSFEKALYAISPNFPLGKLPGDPRFANTYFNMSQGPGEMRGSWNQGENWDFVTDRDKQMAVDGGTGEAEVKLPAKDVDVLKQMADRTMSDPTIDPPTGAELGMSNQTFADGKTVQPGAKPSPGAPLH